MKHYAVSLFAALLMLLVPVSASAAEQVQCVHLDQEGCFTIRLYLLKFDPLNELHKGLSDQANGSKYFTEHLKEVASNLGSPESVSPSSQDIYFALWTNQELNDENLAAYTLDRRNKSKVGTFENVSDSVKFDETLNGKPSAVYRVRSTSIDGRGVALVIPKRLVEPTEMNVLVYMNENMAFPHKLRVKEDVVRKDWPPGFTFGSATVKRIFDEKQRGIKFLGLVIE